MSFCVGILFGTDESSSKSRSRGCARTGTVVVLRIHLQAPRLVHGIMITLKKQPRRRFQQAHSSIEFEFSTNETIVSCDVNPTFFQLFDVAPMTRSHIVILNID